jgi:eukaryotic-like serine/threonine-protein kinase
MAKGPAPGLIIGSRYQLVEIAGSGGMADVWRGRVRGYGNFERAVAIKQMHPALASQPNYVRMFAEEARLGAALHSTNIAEVYDFVADGGNYYMVLEWVEGIDLGSWIRHHISGGEQTKWELVAAISIGVLRGLAAAHDRRDVLGNVVPVVHRDVSPHNVLLTTRGVAKIIDFGLALAPDRTEEMTEPGVVKGKMSYLAPEIVTGGKPRPASDQFAMGSVMWESFVGRKLFDGATDYETFVKLRECRVQPLRPLRPDLPPQLVALVQKALSPMPENRFASAADMAAQISGVLKKAQTRKDWHTLLAQSVVDVKAASKNSARREVSAVTPVVDFDLPSAFAEEAPRMQQLPLPDEKPRGLWHRLSSMARRRPTHME